MQNPILNIPTKNTGDLFTPEEMNQIVDTIIQLGENFENLTITNLSELNTSELRYTNYGVSSSELFQGYSRFLLEIKPLGKYSTSQPFLQTITLLNKKSYKRTGRYINNSLIFDNWEETTGGGGGNVEESTFQEGFVTGIQVGSLPSNTELSGLNALQALELILAKPELFPSLSVPTTSLSLSVGSTYIKVGTSLSGLLLTGSLNRGYIDPYYGGDPPYVQVPRSGQLINHRYSGYNIDTPIDTQSNVSLDFTMPFGACTWYLTSYYETGLQPLSSRGKNYDSALPAGSVTATPITIFGVYPFYATTQSISSYTEQSLQANGSDIIVDLVSEISPNKQTVKIPEVWGNISTIYMFNSVSNVWGTTNLFSTFDSETSEVINGINYRVFTHKGLLIGARRLKFKV